MTIEAKIKEYIEELEKEIDRCISIAEPDPDENISGISVPAMRARRNTAMVRIEALTDVKNDLQGMLDELKNETVRENTGFREPEGEERS